MKTMHPHIQSKADIKSAYNLRRFNVISKYAFHVVEAMALICVIGIIVYAGCNLTSLQRSLLLYAIRTIEILYGLNIAFHLIFFFNKVKEDSHVVKWIVDVLVLVDILAWFTSKLTHAGGDVSESFLGSNIGLIFAAGVYSMVEICFLLSRIPSKRVNPSILMALSFAVFILFGSLALMLPRCTYHGISYVDSLFVASSAVSITGLSTVDVPSTFTHTGVVVLSVLVQMGGLGVLTFTSFFALFYSGTASIYNQLLLKDMVYSKSMNALIPTLLYVIGVTFIIEIAGAVMIYITLPEELGMSMSAKIMLSAFHSMSSFCNAGFSYLPDGMANPVLMGSNQLIYIITSLLIMLGMIGFPIIVNFGEIIKWQLKKLTCRILSKPKPIIPVHIFDINTKVVLCTTIPILIAGSIAFFSLEYDNTLRGMSIYEKIVQSVFNSLIPRSAGFMSVNTGAFLDVTLMVVIVQMIIGGSSQSMAGGIKVNTFGTILLNLKSVIFGHENVTAFHRTISRASVRRANAVVAVSAILLVAYMLIILWLNPTLPTKGLIFETISALFTVGSSLGVTPYLSDASKVILSTAMFLGRVGALSLISVMASSHYDRSSHYPEDNIIIN